MDEKPVKLVELRDGMPSLKDIVGMLRDLADQIEANEIGPFESLYVVGVCETSSVRARRKPSTKG